MNTDRIFSAIKKKLSDLVITNIQVVDVFSQDVFAADVAVSDGVFTGIGDYRGQGRVEIDGTGKFLIPGMIDAHVHIESTLVTPIEYSNAALARGITGVVADPHEIANVCGVAGIEFMIENSRHVPLDIYCMLPSCVPATSFEHSGATLTADDLRPLYSKEGVLGLAEVMDFPAVFAGDSDMLQKLADAEREERRIDGHMAGFDLDQLNGYAVAGIRTDHECDTEKGLVERVRRGIYTLIREGTVCRDLVKMLPAVNERNAPMLCFATDDKHLDDLCSEGGVDASVRMAIRHGLSPATAIQMASLNVARCYHLKNVGAVAPGYYADFSIVSDLDTLKIEEVYKRGRRVATNGVVDERVESASHQAPDNMLASINCPQVTENNLAIAMKGCSKARIIEIVPGTVVSNHLVESVEVENDQFVVDTARDQLKIAVIERHKALGSMAVGVVKGLRLQRGAIATTIAHDSHNLIVAGVTDADMIGAIEAIRTMQGGIVVVDQGRTLASLRLEIGGLMTSAAAEDVLVALGQVGQAARELAPTCAFNPFLALSFMSLVVIPHLKICDSGLFDFSTFSFTEVPVGD
ncbi:adenine deaminase [Desulfopila aestuarii]|uniref:Adenine deaminase n=1 Tax=Desulfopila aestuarii DSM 18488 TaxID=1121416 RepID=A0A1M7YH83_9BACT|nr:adenine deaminase [Desulfopila aestuarii]SHO51941.1 Adenine deaminase [Desulfopila aestuarii DSM 18488]